MCRGNVMVMMSSHEDDFPQAHSQPGVAAKLTAKLKKSTLSVLGQTPLVQM